MILLAVITVVAASYLSIPLPHKPKSIRHKTARKMSNAGFPATINEVLETLRLVRLCLTSGMTVVGALQFVQVRMNEPISGELERALYTNQLGRPLEAALTELAVQNTNWQPMTDSMIAGLRSGNSILEQLADLEAMLRTTIEMKKLKRIKSVAVKSVLPLGICFLPAFILLAVIPLVVGLIGNFTR